MSNLSSDTHLVSISHDPLEEHTSAGLDQEPMARGRRGFAGAPHRESRSLMDRLPARDLMPDDWRPVLLAGAVGLFAAWVVSGMGGRRHARRFEGSRRREFGRWDEHRGRRTHAPAYAAASSDAYAKAGPEGRSSRHDFEMDALNP